MRKRQQKFYYVFYGQVLWIYFVDLGKTTEFFITGVKYIELVELVVEETRRQTS